MFFPFLLHFARIVLRFSLMQALQKFNVLYINALHLLSTKRWIQTFVHSISIIVYVWTLYYSIHSNSFQQVFILSLYLGYLIAFDHLSLLLGQNWRIVLPLPASCIWSSKLNPLNVSFILFLKLFFLDYSFARGKGTNHLIKLLNFIK